MLKKFLVACSVVLLWSAAAMADLTGQWRCDDGGRYYLRQVGSTLYWYGERSATNPRWSNVYDGRIQGNQIRGEWADVPKGQTTSRGQLHLRIQEKGNVLVASHRTGGFGGSRWVRVGYTQPPHASAVREDCLSFNPANAKVARLKGRWKIVDGSQWLFDFGSKQNEARQALRIIKHYRMNQSCFVGRPDPSFQYMLTSGNSPAGSISGDDCIGFNPNNIRVKRVSKRWKIVEGNHMMFDFGNKVSEARQALAIIKKYRFNRSCFVGRPGPSFQYLRR